MRPPSKAIWKKGQSQLVLNFLFRGCLIIAFFLMTYELLVTALSGGLSVSLAEAANSYVGAYTDYVRNGGSYEIRFIITSIGAFPLFVAQVLGLYYFKELGGTTRLVVTYIFFVSILVYTLDGGKQKQFADMMIYVVSTLLAKQAATGRLKLKTLAIVAGVFLGGACVLLSVLSFRYQAIGISLTSLNAQLHPLIDYREGYWLEDFLGEALAFPLVMLSGYIGQGYYGLSLALEQPFTWTSFAGSSYSIAVIINQFFGADFWVEKSYPYLVGYTTGWGSTKWHTVFAWLASDLTFTGTALFFGLLGFIYGQVWREILIHSNPFSILVFTLMNIGFTYAPANNQLMHSPGALSTTLGVFFFYYLFRRNFNE